MSITAEDRSLSHAGQVTDLNPEVPERAKRRSYTAKYKLEILADYEGLDRDAKGALLRREGFLYVVDLGMAQATRPGRP